MKSFAGTWQLTKLALRLDRIKMPVWVLAISGLMFASVPAIEDLIGGQRELVSYVTTRVNSVASRVFGGTIDGPFLGEVLIAEMYLFTAVLIAFMSTLSMVRHTRQNEETNRSELIGSTVVGRYSEITAAFIVTSLANIVTCALLFVAMTTIDIPTTGALGLAGVFLAVGFMFMAVAAIAAQLSETSRGANSICAIAIGAFFLIRGIGDALGTVSADGLSVDPNFLSWLSPLGWGNLVRPFTAQNWWILGLFTGATIVTLIAAAIMLRRRDIGMGILPARSGRAYAKPSLLSTRGLAIKLQKNIFIGWLTLSLILGITFGSLAKEFATLLSENEELAQAFGEIPEGGDITDIFFAAMFGFTAIVITGYCLQALMKAKSEETTGHLEAVLSTATGRLKWIISHLAPTFIGSIIIFIATGIGASLTYILIESGVGFEQFTRFAVAPLVYLPAVLVLLSFGIFLYAFVPRFSTAGMWAAFIFCFVVIQLAELLNLPDWIVNASPYSHIPLVPSEDLTLAPLAILTAIAAVFTVTGLARFNSRDLNVS